MSAIQESTKALRAELERYYRDLCAASTRVNEWLAVMPPNVPNLPTDTALDILAQAGFCVVHKDKLDDAIACVETLAGLGMDQETGEEGEATAVLLAYLKSQRRFAA